MALLNKAAGIAAGYTTNSLPAKAKPEKNSSGNDEIIIIIRNGTVVRFVQHVYYASLEGINGDGI